MCMCVRARLRVCAYVNLLKVVLPLQQKCFQRGFASICLQPFSPASNVHSARRSLYHCHTLVTVFFPAHPNLSVFVCNEAAWMLTYGLNRREL